MMSPLPQIHKPVHSSADALDAIVRSARTEDDAVRHGAIVADQLQSLVDRKLGEFKETATS